MSISPANALVLAASEARSQDAACNTAQADQQAVPGRAERGYIALTAPKAVGAVAYTAAE
jgi:hypothetical protein